MSMLSLEKRLEFYRDDIRRTEQYLSSCPKGDPMVENYLKELRVAVKNIEKELGIKPTKGVDLPEAVVSFVQKIKIYGVNCHYDVNHTYGDHPYSYHLDLVYEFAKKYIHLIPKGDRKYVLAACYTHDVIEDCRQTYDDVKEKCGIEIAEITYALTNEKGRTRKERANDKYYEEIRRNTNAWFIKICDRLANIKGSIEEGSSFTDMYRKEHDHFFNKLFVGNYSPMFEEMEEMLFGKKK